jgi:hypothetical protein
MAISSCRSLQKGVVVAHHQHVRDAGVQDVGLLALGVQPLLELLVGVDRPTDHRAHADDAGVRVGQRGRVGPHRQRLEPHVAAVALDVAPGQRLPALICGGGFLRLR